jgi:hypothetical protein
VPELRQRLAPHPQTHVLSDFVIASTGLVCVAARAFISSGPKTRLLLLGSELYVSPRRTTLTTMCFRFVWQEMQRTGFDQAAFQRQVDAALQSVRSQQEVLSQSISGATVFNPFLSAASPSLEQTLPAPPPPLPTPSGATRPPAPTVTSPLPPAPIVPLGAVTSPRKSTVVHAAAASPSAPALAELDGGTPKLLTPDALLKKMYACLPLSTLTCYQDALVAERSNSKLRPGQTCQSRRARSCRLWRGCVDFQDNELIHYLRSLCGSATRVLLVCPVAAVQSQGNEGAIPHGTLP